jgi:Cys-tRNA(Pro)/Cys-tRNA(Cys) deacylase
VGFPLEQVWKTLVCRGDGRDVGFAVIAGDAELDLKAYARLAGHKAAGLVPLEDVQPLTGYVRGGCTALAAKKPFPTHVDETIELHDAVCVSAGVRGLQIVLAPADYLRATGAKVGPIAR